MEKNNLEVKRESILERNRLLRAGKYVIIGGGFCFFGDLIIVGERAEEAGNILYEQLYNCYNKEEATEYLAGCRKNFSVQIWRRWEFDLNRVLTLPQIQGE